jgi:NAD(P)H-hydrate epimerase
VIDAGALEAFSTQPGFDGRPGDVLTPHEGELERLLPRDGRTRPEWATAAAKTFRATVLLKGARSVVAGAEDDDVWFNTTGNSGMATGGMGDVLTGVIAALMGAGIKGRQAAGLGAWLCGCAADIAITQGDPSKESLTARDVINFLGKAFLRLHKATSD